MIDSRIDSNVDRIRLRFSAYARELENTAAVRALNRAGDQAATAVSREIRATYNIKARTVAEAIKIRDRARPGRLEFTIRIFSRRIPLIEFSARQTRKGVTAQVVKGGGRNLIPRAFIAKMWGGHKGVFARAHTGKSGSSVPFRFGRRSGQPGRGWGEPDLPIAQLMSISVPGMFLKRGVRDRAAAVAIESFRRNFIQQLAFLESRR